MREPDTNWRHVLDIAISGHESSETRSFRTVRNPTRDPAGGSLIEQFAVQIAGEAAKPFQRFE
jgi:hypothetical protein